jgi:hypothetical protein
MKLKTFIIALQNTGSKIVLNYLNRVHIFSFLILYDPIIVIHPLTPKLIKLSSSEFLHSYIHRTFSIYLVVLEFIYLITIGGR